MDKEQAIGAVYEAVKKHQGEFYGYPPAGQTRDFLPAWAMGAIGQALLTAFLDGLESSLKDQLKEWGKKVAAWLGNEIEQLFKTMRPSAGGDLDGKIAGIKQLMASVPANQQVQMANEVQKILEAALQPKIHDAAEPIAETTRNAAMALSVGG